MLNPRLDQLMTYPFERLAGLLDGIDPPAGITPITLSLGEPRHEPPGFVAEILAAAGAGWGRYPPTRGTPAFRQAVADWLARRYRLPEGLISADAHVISCSGTREALFMVAFVAITEQPAGAPPPAVLVPNPLYHVYGGAAVIAGGEPVFIPADRATGFLPDFAAMDSALLRRTALAYLCSPANPQGAVAGLERLHELVELAIEHDFILAVDECYSEIFDTAPPPGALEAVAGFGRRAREALEHVVIFNSLSKRSSAPGLRSGFVAGGAAPIAAFARLRNYASSQTPLPIISVAEQLWRDESHVDASRARYRAKLDLAEAALSGHYGFYRPGGGFFLWLEVGDGDRAAQRLWAEAGLKVLPGSCLCPAGDEARRPGAPYIRLALVHDPDTLGDALGRLRRVLN